TSDSACTVLPLRLNVLDAPRTLIPDGSAARDSDVVEWVSADIRSLLPPGGVRVVFRGKHLSVEPHPVLPHHSCHGLLVEPVPAQRLLLGGEGPGVREPGQRWLLAGVGGRSGAILRLLAPAALPHPLQVL